MITIVEYLAREIKNRTYCDIRISVSPSNSLSESRSCGYNKRIRPPLPLCGDKSIWLIAFM